MSSTNSKRNWLIASAAGAAGLVIGFAGISSATPSASTTPATVVAAAVADTTLTTVAPASGSTAPATAPVTPAPVTSTTGVTTPTVENSDNGVSETSEQATLAAQAKVSEADARTAALAAKPGTVTSAKLDDHGSGVQWHIEITTATGFADVNVDAVTGKVTNSRDETAEHQGGGNGGNEAKDVNGKEANGQPEQADPAATTGATTAPAANA